MKFCIYDYDGEYYIIPADKYTEMDDWMWERAEHESVKTRFDPPEWARYAGIDLGCITFDGWEVV